jgi:hypothetical protein
MQGLLNAEHAYAFCFAGKARFTLESKKTGCRYTYKVTEKKNSNKTVFWLSLMYGPNNTSDYKYAGRIDIGTRAIFTSTQRSMIEPDAPSMVVFRWALNRGFEHPDLNFWHEGKCGRCGKLLTTPESVARGLGPVCDGR